MPFGLIFGALFFVTIGSALGMRWLVQPALEGRVVGLLMIALGVSLGLGLALRRSWARWGGAALAALLTVVGLRMVADEGHAIAHVLFFASAVAFLLLLIPATGDPRRGTSREASAGTRFGAAGWTAAFSVLGLAAVGAVNDAGPVASVAPGDRALPASAVGKRIRWNEFDAGLDLARAERKPVIATFVTDWCPYCTKMSRNTWRASGVTERLEDLVAVKVNADEGAAGGRVAGQEIAARYGVHGYPVQMLLDAEGRVIARHEGYQDSGQLLAWLDDALGR